MWVKKHHIFFFIYRTFFALKKQYKIKETTNKSTFVPFVTLIISFCKLMCMNWYLVVRRLSRGVTKHHKHFRYMPFFFAYIAKLDFMLRNKKYRSPIEFFFFKMSSAYVFLLYFCVIKNKKFKNSIFIKNS